MAGGLLQGGDDRGGKFEKILSLQGRQYGEQASRLFTQARCLCPIL